MSLIKIGVICKRERENKAQFVDKRSSFNYNFIIETKTRALCDVKLIFRFYLVLYCSATRRSINCLIEDEMGSHHVTKWEKDYNFFWGCSSREMNENYQSKQRNDKNHRKLVRSPESVPPCDFDASLNPLLLSSTSSSVRQTSPVKSQNEFISSKPKEAWHPQPQQHDENSSSLPPSLSAPSMTIFRKPSISIKCSEEERDQISRASASSFMGNQSSLMLHQVNSKSIDSSCLLNRTISVTQEQVDQASNNFLTKNNSPHHNVVSPIRTPQQQQQQFHHHHQSWFSDSSNYGSTKHDIYQQQQTEQHQQQRDYGAVEFSMSTSMDANVISHTQTFTQSQPLTRGQMIFNHNNPFLSDSFENTTSDVNGKVDESFFSIDDSNESDLLYFVERSKNRLPEQSSVRNKREKFSQNASTKICLVVSPPTNKFQVSFLLHHISRLLFLTTWWTS